MKVTAFVGSARKRHTYNATKRLLENLKLLGEVDYEIVSLSDYNLKLCRGCKRCCDIGEEFCPLKDDRDKLIKKMLDSDGVVFASPTYTFQVSGSMKAFLDRLAFICHRPRFFGKAFTSIAVQGMHGGRDVVKYLDLVGDMLGFNVVKGSCLAALDPMTEDEQKKNNQILDKQSREFFSTLIRKEYPAPSFFKLMIFRMSRTSLKLVLNETWRDYEHYKKKGWFESDYFYPARLNPVKKVAGNFFDWLAVKTNKTPKLPSYSDYIKDSGSRPSTKKEMR